MSSRKFFLLCISLVLAVLLTVIAGKEGEEMHGGLIEGQRTSAVLYNEGDKVVNLPMAAN